MVPFIVSALALGGLPVVGVKLYKRRKARQAELAPPVFEAPPTVVRPPASTTPAPTPAPTPAAPPTPAAAVLSAVPQVINTAKTVASLTGGAVSGGVVAAGLAAAAASKVIVGDLLKGGEGQGNLAAVAGVAALPTLAVNAAVKQLGEKVGLSQSLARDLGHVVAAGPALAPAVIGAKLINKGAEELVGLIGGTKAKEGFKDIVHAFDVSDSKQPAGKVVAAVANVVTAPFKGLTDLFGGKKPAPAPPKPTPPPAPAPAPKPITVAGIKLPPLPVIKPPAIKLPAIKLPFGLGKK